MGLQEKPEVIGWPRSHYLFIEKVGNIQQSAPQAWQELHKLIPTIGSDIVAVGYTSLYKVFPQAVYRAGIMVQSRPSKEIQGLQYEEFSGGKYLRFILRGSYAQLPEACGRVMEIIQTSPAKIREGFFIENYANDPRTTPESELITEILVPIE